MDTDSKTKNRLRIFFAGSLFLSRLFYIFAFIAFFLLFFAFIAFFFAFFCFFLLLFSRMSTKETDHPKECGIEQRLKVFMESIDITSSGKIMTELNLDTPLDKLKVCTFLHSCFPFPFPLNTSLPIFSPTQNTLKEIALECGLKMATIVTKEVSGPLVWLANQSTNERKENIPKNSESQTPKRQLSPNINRSSKRKRLDS